MSGSIFYHCKKCKRAWATWKPPVLACGHAVPQFGCRLCIEYMQAKATWDFFHSDEFKLPKCGECKTTMMLYENRGSILEFACPRTNRCGDMCCEEDSAFATVSPMLVPNGR